MLYHLLAVAHNTSRPMCVHAVWGVWADKVLPGWKWRRIVYQQN
jgi:hypothetical protein